MSWWETLHLVTWWKRLGISAIKTGQDAPSWIWCTERLSFFGGGHIVLQCFVHVRCHFQPLPTKLVFAYFDRGSYITCIQRSPDGTNMAWQLDMKGWLQHCGETGTVVGEHASAPRDAGINTPWNLHFHPEIFSGSIICFRGSLAHPTHGKTQHIPGTPDTQ